MIDLSISLGNLLTIASFVVGGVVFVVTMRADNKALERVVEVRLTVVDKQIDAITAEIKKLAEVLIVVAKQDARIGSMDARLQQQGERLDELTNRFNRTINGQILNRRGRDESA
jgi:hypothetical protein